MEIPVKGQKSLNIVMKENVESLDEIVVIGYGTMKKKDLTGSVSAIKPTKSQPLLFLILSRLCRGGFRGLFFRRIPEIHRAITRSVFGESIYQGDNAPLYIIDGIPASTSSVNTYDIESMEILKDASATAIYGSRGANGVVMITTKKGKPEKQPFPMILNTAFRNR